MATPSPPSRSWLFGPAPDLLLGCGALYLLFFGIFVGAGDWFVSAVPAWIAPLCVLLVGMPHYGATLVRVYEHRRDRRAYTFFTVHVTVALLVAFVAGVYSPGVGSILLTVYLTWSPWHYTGQNYGLAVMFLRRGGVAMVGATKRWLYASFVLSYALTFSVIHESSVWAGARSLPEIGPALHFVPVGIPFSAVVVPTVAAAWLVATAGAATLLLRRSHPRALLPVAVLVLSQSIWFAVPSLALHWPLFPGVGPLDPSSLGFFLVWIAVGHSVQYLWVTAYYARASSDFKGTMPWFGKTLAAGALVWTLPVVLFAARPLGAPSYETGMAFLVASVVNLHHFILDGAIWKLRDSRIARVLVGSGESDDDDQPRRAWLGKAVWALATACLLAALFVFSLESWLLPRALEQKDLARTESILDRLALLGRDSSTARAQLGTWYTDERRNDLALVQFERSVALVPSAWTWSEVAMARARLGDLEGSVRAQDEAMALEPTEALFEWGALLSERTGLKERADRLRARAAGLGDDGSQPLPAIE
jgi:hypothetical protein